ncbi:MAG: alpha/beta fold hydrolase [Hyphomicrobiaceae bacterium]
MSNSNFKQSNLTLVSPPAPAQTTAPVKPPHQPLVAPANRECDPPSETEAFGDALDRTLHAAAARYTGGLSPAALTAAYVDWATHLAMSPGKRMQLVDKALRKTLRLGGQLANPATAAGTAGPCIEPLPQDRRFAGEAWQKWPYNFYYQNFLLQQQWWHNATIGVRGVTKQHENVVEFAARQILDMVAPSNFLLTNPELQQKTLEQAGMNFVRGAQNFAQDLELTTSGKSPPGAEAFKVGQDVAATPGKVVYRNHLIELIQYEPTTATVHPEPVLIVPAWIMKYYILDLSPHNSLVSYLTGQGFTVFMVSWKNPDQQDRDLGMEDYRLLGVMAAVDAVEKIVRDKPIHAVGYCIGGTLLSAAASAMARDGDMRLGSMTLFAAQTDFHEAGELMLFINESQLSFLDDMMWAKGFLDTKQMSGAFQLLRSNDLVWSHMLHEYMMGERAPLSDLMAWNADATRMPYKMHSEYLRRLFLDNDLAEGRFLAGGKPVALSDIRVPIFAVGTTHDHVAPWRSVYKIHLLTDTQVTFLLTTGGHNAGIVSDLEHKGRSYQVATKPLGENYSDPDGWAATAPRTQGSWWPQWSSWLASRSGKKVPPPSMGAPAKGLPALCDAPGTYVLQK